MRRTICLLILMFFCLPLPGQTNAVILDNAGAALRDVVGFCPGETMDLKVNAAGYSTSAYTITKEIATFHAGSTDFKFNTTNSNVFSEAVPLGFNFEFYGTRYNAVAVGRNGRVVFSNTKLGELKDETKYKDRTFSGLPGINGYAKLPSPNYNKVILNDAATEINLAQIFAGYTDVIFSESYKGKTLYKFTTNAVINGQKGFLISFQELVWTNTTGGFSGRDYNSNVFLSQTGEIKIFVNNKTEDSYNAILGIQNENGTKAEVPPHSTVGSDYNNGRWKSENVAFSFAPAQKIISKIEWFEDGANIGTGAALVYTPSDGRVLKAIITFADGTTAEGSVTFKNFVKPTVLATPGTGCGAGTALSVTNPQAGYSYGWISDADPAPRPLTDPVTVSGTYYVVPNGCPAQKSDPVAMVISSPITPPAFPDGMNFPYCDNLGQSSVPINLLTLINYTPDAGSTVVFTDVAGNIIGNAANNYTVSVNSGSPLNVVMGITSSVVNCPFSKPFVVSYQSFPSSQIALTSDKLCFGTTNYGIAKFRADFPQYSAYDVGVSTDNVNFNLNSVNPSVTNPAYVRLSKSGFGCTSTITLNFDFYDEILIKPITPFPDHCTSSTEFFDLNITKAELEYAPNITATFYSDAARIQQITNLHYRGGGTIYTKISNGKCAIDGPQFQLNVYPPPTLIKNGPEIKYSECGSDTFDLSTNIFDYAPDWTRYYEIWYYDKNGNKLSESQWRNYNPDVSGNPYMVFVFNETNNMECSNRIGFTLVKKIKPTFAQSQIPVCGQTSYSLDDFKKFITNNNASAFDFTDENGNPLPAQFNVVNLPTVRVIIKDKNTHCSSGVQQVQFVNGSPTPLLTDHHALTPACDTDSDGVGVSFDLTAAQKFISSDAAAVFVYFDSAGRLIPNPRDYKNQTAFAETVHGKVSSGILCPTDFSVELTVNVPSELQAVVNTNLCFGEALTVEIDNFTEFQSVELISPKGTIPVQKSLTINYADVKIGSKYTLKASNLKGCDSYFEFTPTDQNQPKISQVNQSDSQIEVIAGGGAPPYTYYFNGVKNPSGNILQNPTEDQYEIYVVSADGCRGPSAFVYNIKIPNAITPNGDGINDVWQVKNLDKMMEVQVNIADRYGNVVFQSSDAHKTVWDGTASGRQLPTASYWYVVKWHDPVQHKDVVRQGWILLKNRN